MKRSLSEVFNVKHGYAFVGEHIVDEDNGFVLVTPGNFKIGGGFQEDKCKFYDGDVPENYVLKPNDYIVTMTDLSKTIDTLGFSAKVPSTTGRIYLHNQRIGLLNFVNDNEFDRDFVYYLMQSRNYQRTIANTSTGATVHHTSPEKIGKYVFDFPPLSTQHRIANILSAYDDLIENNRKQIKLLEEAAQRLYKEWFVDLRFPGHEKVKITDGVPEGWERKPISGIADVVMGTSPKSEFYNLCKNGLPFHQGVGSFGDRFVEDTIYSSSITKIADAGSILFSVRAPVGRMNLTRNKVVIGRGLAAINHKNGCQSYLFYMLKEKFFCDNIIGNGSIFASINKDDLLAEKMLVANDIVVRLFEKLVQSIDSDILCLFEQNKLLQEAKDRLLPKLMSGEIEV